MKKICRERQEELGQHQAVRGQEGAGKAAEATPELLELCDACSFHLNSRTFKKPGLGGHPQSFSKSKDRSLASGRPGRTVRGLQG